MYPDGKIVWMGRTGCKTDFFCRIKKTTNNHYKAILKGHDGTMLNELGNLLYLYEDESDLVMNANGWV